MGAILSTKRQGASLGENVSAEAKNVKSHNFQHNGALLLQKQIYHLKGNSAPIRIFSEEELKKATNNFSHVIDQNGWSCMFKGLLDGRAVSVKRGREIISRFYYEISITEIVILSSINHRNVARFLGCCIETLVPILVYEHVSNGNLENHIILRESKHRQPIPWLDRLRIATEVADALNYLHIHSSEAIVHRDINLRHILLDEHLTAKITGFDRMFPMPVGVTLAEDMVVGSSSHIDPEYAITGQLNEKNDVYSFGVVLIHLLTGKEKIYIRGEYYNLVEAFISHMRKGCAAKILETTVLKEGKIKQIQAFTDVAMRCVCHNREERPTMKEVVLELRQIRKT